MHAQPGVGGGTTQLFANGARLADEAAQPANVERDHVIAPRHARSALSLSKSAVRFDPRRKIARELNEGQKRKVRRVREVRPVRWVREARHSLSSGFTGQAEAASLCSDVHRVSRRLQIEARE